MYKEITEIAKGILSFIVIVMTIAFTVIIIKDNLPDLSFSEILLIIVAVLLNLGVILFGLDKFFDFLGEDKKNFFGLLWLVLLLCIIPYAAKLIYSFFLPDKKISYLFSLCSGAAFCFALLLIYFNYLNVIDKLNISKIRKNAYNTFEKRLASNPEETKSILTVFLDAQKRYLDWKKEHSWRAHKQLENRDELNYRDSDYKKRQEVGILAEKLYGEKYFDSKLTKRIEKRILQEPIDVHYDMIESNSRPIANKPVIHIPASQKIFRSKTPEQEELERKHAEFEALKQELAQEELNLATLENELNLFERLYLRIVGVLYAQLDEILANIAKQLAKQNPKDAEAQTHAKQARRQAKQSTSAAKEIDVQIQSAPFSPSDEIKELYRKAARLMHPDFAGDEDDRASRTRFMAEVNNAYRSGDINRLQMLLNEWKNSPESVRGEDTGAELLRVIRSIARVQERLNFIRSRLGETQVSELYTLKTKVEEAEKEGKDLLAEMAGNLRKEIETANKTLDDLS